MKYSKLPDEEKTNLHSYLVKQASQQSSVGRDVFESTSKSVLLVNTGGVAVVASFMSAKVVSDGFWVKVSLLSFVFSVLVFIVNRLLLSLRIGESVSKIKEFHTNALNDLVDVDAESVRSAMNSFSAGLEGSQSIWPLGISILLSFIAVVLGGVGLFC